ncbi:DUF4245 domain-containing protein [Streptomyces sp. NPDC002676]
MAGSYGKQKKTVRGLVQSLGVCVMAAAIVYLVVPHDDHAPGIKRVDYSVELVTARRAASYPVAAPEGLSKDWKATSVTYDSKDAQHWHLGFQDPEGQYVQIEQGRQNRGDFIHEASQGAKATKQTENIGGRTWTRYSGGRYEALVLEDTSGSTTVVAGTASFGQLTKMAAALKMAKG